MKPLVLVAPALVTALAACDGADATHVGYTSRITTTLGDATVTEVEVVASVPTDGESAAPYLDAHLLAGPAAGPLVALSPGEPGRYRATLPDLAPAYQIVIDDEPFHFPAPAAFAATVTRDAAGVTLVWSPPVPRDLDADRLWIDVLAPGAPPAGCDGARATWADGDRLVLPACGFERAGTYRLSLTRSRSVIEVNGPGGTDELIYALASHDVVRRLELVVP